MEWTQRMDCSEGDGMKALGCLFESRVVVDEGTMHGAWRVPVDGLFWGLERGKRLSNRL